MAQKDPGTEVISALVEEYRQRRKEVSSKEKPVQTYRNRQAGKNPMEQWYKDRKMNPVRLPNG